MNIDLVHHLLVRTAIASREDAARNASEALRRGNLKEIVAWRSRLLKIEKRIARFRLDPK